MLLFLVTVALRAHTAVQNVTVHSLGNNTGDAPPLPKNLQQFNFHPLLKTFVNSDVYQCSTTDCSVALCAKKTFACAVSERLLVLREIDEQILALSINEFGCYEAKIVESEKAGSRQEL